ncbi:MAG: GFA family protein [Gammaproteobacteria bacterium]
MLPTSTEAVAVELILHLGGCHCGTVRFEIEAPAKIEVHDCNCSICCLTGYLHLIVPESSFRLVSGRDALISYRFNTGVADHLFCKICGVKSFYRPRSHPSSFSVNARCLDAGTVEQQTVFPFDGANWEAHIAELHPQAQD